MNKIKHLLAYLKEKYDQPTPLQWRRIGDYFLWCGQFISASIIVSGHPWMGIVAMGLSVFGKAITNFKGKSDESS